jgi:pyruvate dehydrogenase E2 component (dihydrolipoamide acetyltransferase)
MADLRIPDLGEGVEQGVVIALLVQAGDTVLAGQGVLEIETDKVTLEVPAPRAGVVEEVCVAVDALVQPGDVVLRMRDDAGPTLNVSGADTIQPFVPRAAAVPAPATQPTPRTHVASLAVQAAALPAGPSARREARQLGIGIGDVKGSGARGRISASDVRRHVRDIMQSAASTSPPPVVELPDLSAFGAVKRVPLSRVDKVTARNLTRSAAMIPQAWLEHRADVTELETLRRRVRKAQPPQQAPMTLTAILCKAMAHAMTEFPRFNAAIDEQSQDIVYREYCNIGVAVDTPEGLMVPVVRDVAARDLPAIADELQRLSIAARDQQLQPGELRGAGITISNLGALGVSAIQPLVNWPEAAIIGVAAAQEVVFSHGQGFRSRQVLPLTLGFDHRLINGADGARFLSCIGHLLADPQALGLSI